MTTQVGPETATETPIQAKDRLGRNQRPHDAKGKFARRDGSPGQQPVAQRLAYGKDLLPHVDGRSPTYKRYKEICSALAADQGGADTLSAARAQLIRRFAAASVLAEQMENRDLTSVQRAVALDSQQRDEAAALRFNLNDAAALHRPGYRFSINDAALDAKEQAYRDVDLAQSNAWRSKDAEPSDARKGNDREIPLRQITGDSRVDAYLSYQEDVENRWRGTR